MMGLRNAFRHPLSVAAGAVSLVAGVIQFPLLFDLGHWLVSSSGTLFTAFSIFGFTIAPNVDWLPTSLLEPVAIGLGFIYGLSRLYRAVTNYGDTQ